MYRRYFIMSDVSVLPNQCNFVCYNHILESILKKKEKKEKTISLNHSLNFL